ncbi:hypothetical protein BD410DRAFT_842915 [Rickenella mellea]|uniref:Uncharacterized protein n=1 Tax=Rickenella mellea TaxID=50990 RepID=A0A4Y7PSE0_9AGAM|nr:hypothetical protein BD410DRAFT_842915 [Rickenella mellea]
MIAREVVVGDGKQEEGRHDVKWVPAAPPSLSFFGIGTHDMEALDEEGEIQDRFPHTKDGSLYATKCLSILYLLDLLHHDRRQIHHNSHSTEILLQLNNAHRTELLRDRSKLGDPLEYLAPMDNHVMEPRALCFCARVCRDAFGGQVLPHEDAAPKGRVDGDAEAVRDGGWRIRFRRGPA